MVVATSTTTTTTTTATTSLKLLNLFTISPVASKYFGRRFAALAVAALGEGIA